MLWKAFLGEINFWIEAAVQFHNVLHGFWAGQGTVTASIEANLIHQPTKLREEVVNEVLLEILKSYDALDRERCLEILM